MQRAMPGQILKITGAYLPDIPKCDNLLTIAGRTIDLLAGPMIHEHCDYHIARDALRHVLYNELDNMEAAQHIYELPPEEQAMAQAKYRQQNYDALYEKMRNAYVTLLREEIKHGCVRIPVKYQFLDETAMVKNIYGGVVPNSSPVLTEVLSTAPNALEMTAHIFAESFILHKPCSVLTVYFKRSVREQDYHKVQCLMREFMHHVNDYYVDTYHAKASGSRTQ